MDISPQVVGQQGKDNMKEAPYVVGPEYRGAPYPPFEEKAINESHLPDNMRFKHYSSAEHRFEGLTQEPFTAADFNAFVKEIRRAYKAVGIAGSITIVAKDRDHTSRGYRIIKIKEV